MALIRSPFSASIWRVVNPQLRWSWPWATLSDWRERLSVSARERVCVMVGGRGVRARDESRRTGGVTVSFGERFAASDQFDAIFREGMALVERTAAYLDGPGRKEAKSLPGPAAMLYANESMRLTKRLLQLASWLMIRRDH